MQFHWYVPEELNLSKKLRDSLVVAIKIPTYFMYYWAGLGLVY